MVKQIISAVLALFFLPIFFLIFLFLLFAPLMAFFDIKSVIEHGVPKYNIYFVALFLISFTLYLSVRVRSFRKIYEFIPVLWPLSTMLFITTMGLAFGLLFMNLWAENEVISKGIAIFLSIFSFILVRMFMSYWYKKYPISVKMFK
ncbi:hypothetical protein BTR23_13395 [Alkalihalophilus pseudofirmus]|nr:hypothetical protein BTR23_13395 [Alkalihalophilus pseudofirmus]